jgi:hypothetical protein
MIHCSADSFFYTPIETPVENLPSAFEMHGVAPLILSSPFTIERFCEYNFNPALLPQAHTVCMGVFIKALTEGMPLVVVDNTCSQLWEYRNYVALAEALGYEVQILSLPVPKTIEEAKVIFDRQEHGVPLDIFLKMWWRWEFDPREETVVAEDPNHD